jgi:tRNA 5-methylaminomethyl-2-thiouridine biosynthesis bifunctional protein
MPNVEQHKAVYKHLAKDKNFKVATPAPCLENLYVLTGLGARGLCSAPLLADILIADLCNTPYPVNYKMLYNLSPNRFIIKAIVKGLKD